VHLDNTTSAYKTSADWQHNKKGFTPNGESWNLLYFCKIISLAFKIFNLWAIDLILTTFKSSF